MSHAPSNWSQISAKEPCDHDNRSNHGNSSSWSWSPAHHSLSNPLAADGKFGRGSGFCYLDECLGIWLGRALLL